MSVRRLKVLRVYSRLETGGIETRLIDLLPRLDRTRFDVSLLCIKRRGSLADRLQDAGIPVESIRLHGHTPQPLSLWRLTRWLRKRRPDIVHAHTIEPALYATAAGERAGVPILLANYHNVRSIDTKRQIRLERTQSRLRSATLHVSECVHRDYLDQIDPLVDNGIVVYNGVDIARFASLPEPANRDAKLRELGLEPGRGPRVLSVGRLHHNKNCLAQVRVAERLRERFPGITWLLAGEGPARKEMEAAIADRGLADTVRLLGDREDVHELYHLADLHLLSSLKEGFSNVVLEAMAAGCAQVLTDVGGNREAVGEDDAAAIVIPPNDDDALARAVERVLGDEEVRQSMRRVARERVERFSVACQLRKTEELYSRLAEERGLM